MKPPPARRRERQPETPFPASARHTTSTNRTPHPEKGTARHALFDFRRHFRGRRHHGRLDAHRRRPQPPRAALRPAARAGIPPHRETTRPESVHVRPVPGTAPAVVRRSAAPETRKPCSPPCPESAPNPPILSRPSLSNLDTAHRPPARRMVNYS